MNLVHIHTDLCLDLPVAESSVVLKGCADHASQKWTFEQIPWKWSRNTIERHPLNRPFRFITIWRCCDCRCNILAKASNCVRRRMRFYVRIFIMKQNFFRTKQIKFHKTCKVVFFFILKIFQWAQSQNMFNLRFFWKRNIRQET